MNLSLPICAGITSTPIYFLHINFFLHILILLTQLFIYPSKSCESKFIKFNQIIQKLTFLLYHLCFYVLYFFNISEIKQILIKKEIIDDGIMGKVNQILGMMIIILFTCGGVHEMVQFLVKIAHDLFKILYMVMIVLTGGYEIDQDQMKLNNFIKENKNMSHKNVDIYKQLIDNLLNNKSNKNQSNQKQLLQQPQKYHQIQSPLQISSISHPKHFQQNQSQQSETTDIELLELQQKIQLLSLANKLIKLSEQNNNQNQSNQSNHQNQIKNNENNLNNQNDKINKQLQSIKKIKEDNSLKFKFCQKNRQIRSEDVQVIEEIQNNNNKQDEEQKSLQLIMFFQPNHQAQTN